MSESMKRISFLSAWVCLLMSCWTFADVHVRFDTESKLEFQDTSAPGTYDMTLFLKMKETRTPEESPVQIHSFRATVKLPDGITAAKEDLLFNPALVSKETGSLVNNSSFKAETNELILDYAVEAVAGKDTPGSFQLSDSNQEILRVPLKIVWSDQIFGNHALTPAVTMQEVSARADGSQTAGVPQLSESRRLSDSWCAPAV